MPRRPPFQPEPGDAALAGPAFRARSAADAGYSRRDLSGRRLIIPTRSIRSPVELESIEERAAAYALALPDDVVFSHLTAAHLLGLPLPPRLASQSRSLDLMRRTRKAQIDRAGCSSHRGLERRATSDVRGLQVTGIADTWCDIIEKHHDEITLANAVMMGDAAVELLHPTRRANREVHPCVPPRSAAWWSDPANVGVRLLRERVLVRRRWRGNEMARAALARVRPRVWSPMETHARLVVVDGGVREPRLNATIRFHDGGFLMVGDLVWDGEEVVGEYNGAVHEGGRSRQHDNSKRLMLEDEDWWLLEIYKQDVFTASGRYQLIHRLRSGLSRRGRPTRDGF